MTGGKCLAARQVRAAQLAWWASLLLAVAIGQTACSTARNHDAANHQMPPSYATLELNDGKKWTVDPPMMAHLRNLEQAVQASSTIHAVNHPALAANLQENLGRLVTNCTMEGKAHDELHKWLMPFLAMTAEYSEAADPKVQWQKLQEIKGALLVFNAHFE